MDIHRCRFVPYPSSAINALAFSHTSTPTIRSKGPPNLRLAIGRANGNIEIWNPLRGAWYQESVIPGGKDRSIEGLIWIQDPEDLDKNGYKVAGKLRLFSIGYSTAVTEWDLASGRPARHSGGNYGEIWCMAAQPKGQPIKAAINGHKQEQGLEGADSQVQNIAVGCADGAIVLLDTADGDLRFSRILARPSKKRSRVLSITFQNRHTIIAGYADSTIRIHDIRNLQSMRSMTLGAGPKGGPQEVLVWSVKCSSPETIVSGDSTGTLSFWDGKNYTLLQRIKSHEADILDVIISADGQTVFSGGMDRRTTQYRRSGNGRPGEKNRWAKIAHQRFHKHDVKAMATFETRDLSILASGGLDAAPIIIPIREFGRENHRTLSILPHQPALKSASRQRLVTSWWEREVNVWSIDRSKKGAIGNDGSLEIDEVRGRKLVAKIVLQGEESITSVDLSSNGSMLAVSTMAELKFFRLRQKAGSVKVQKVEVPLEMGKKGAKSVHISPDQKWLASVTTDNIIQLRRFSEDDGSKQKIRILDSTISLNRLRRDPTIASYQHGSLGNYDRSIIRLSFSADSRILAAADISGFLDTWVLEGYEDMTQNSQANGRSTQSPMSSDDDESGVDSDEEKHATIVFGQHWIRNPSASLLIRLPAAPLILTFRPSITQRTAALTNGNLGIHPTRHTPHPHSHDLPAGEDRLFVLTAENQMYEFNVLSGRISDWSRRNPSSSLPQNFIDLKDRAMGAVWDVRRQHTRIWLYGVTWLWMFDLSKDLPHSKDHESKTPITDDDNRRMQLKRKRNREIEDDESHTRRKEDSGAGSKMARSKPGLGIRPDVRKIKGTEDGVGQLISLDKNGGSVPEDEGEGEDGLMLADENDLTLRSLRRATQDDDSNTDVEATAGAAGKGEHPRRRKYAERPSCWHTFKYRPILGIVPLGGETDDEASSEQEEDLDQESPGIEVALIERPLWDMDLPPQYHGNQEWDP